jgi:hypothetical protein
VETANVWHVSSFSLDIHLPSPLYIELEEHKLTFYPGRRHKKEVSVVVLAKGKQVIRQRGTGKCTMKSQRLFAQEGHLHAQHGRISRGRE